MNSGKMYNKRVLDYAYKYIADCSQYPTMENMKNIFSKCVREPKNDKMYFDIMEMIIQINTQF